MQKKHLIAYPATALLAFAVGGASSGTRTEAAPKPSSTATVTTTAPAPAARTMTATPTVRVTKTASPQEPETAMAGDGTYEVGVDVKPGTYVSAPTDSLNCYWERSRGGDGLNSIVANGNTTGQVVVTIRKSDKFFTTSGCSDWKRR
jgi:hypothetical protein